jgi:hypothetical protein
MRICQQTLHEVAGGSHGRINNCLDRDWVPLDNEAVAQKALKEVSIFYFYIFIWPNFPKFG